MSNKLYAGDSVVENRALCAAASQLIPIKINSSRRRDDPHESDLNSICSSFTTVTATWTRQPRAFRNWSGMYVLTKSCVMDFLFSIRASHMHSICVKKTMVMIRRRGVQRDCCSEVFVRPCFACIICCRWCFWVE